jgi:hypothetical protein
MDDMDDLDVAADVAAPPFSLLRPCGALLPVLAHCGRRAGSRARCPGEVLSDARLLASELVANGSGAIYRPRRRCFASRSRSVATRYVSTPASPAVPAWAWAFSSLATRWWVDDAGGTRLWVKIDAA